MFSGCLYFCWQIYIEKHAQYAATSKTEDCKMKEEEIKHANRRSTHKMQFESLNIESNNGRNYR
jgi:hypothetical protein